MYKYFLLLVLFSGVEAANRDFRNYENNQIHRPSRQRVFGRFTKPERGSFEKVDFSTLLPSSSTMRKALPAILVLGTFASVLSQVNADAALETCIKECNSDCLSAYVDSLFYRGRGFSFGACALSCSSGCTRRFANGEL